MKAYLDNAATTPVCPEAAQAALRMMTDDFGNPSSTHAPGRAAREVLINARATIAASLGAKPEEIYFTAGGTESDNWALRSGAQKMRHRGKHIISSTIEHDAIRKSLDELERLGYEITRLTPAADGSIHADALAAALRPDTILVSLMLVNNETGAINDIAAFARAIKAAGCPALLHTDAVQGYGKLAFTAKSLGADMISLSAHKINAMKGTGALYVKSGLKLPALLLGGGQEAALRSGTENMPGIAAFAAAVEAAKADKGYIERMAALRTHILDRLQAENPQLVVIGGGAPHLICVSLPGWRSEVLLNYLDAKGVSISKGSACKRGGRSHVLEAMGLDARVIDGAVRVSLSRLTTQDEADYFCDCFTEARKTLLST